MSWIIACDRGRSVVSGNSLAHDGLMTRGTFMVEFALQSADLRPRKLIDYERSATWARVFILYLNADGSVSVENRQGRSCSYARVNTPIRFPGRVRVTYNWDGPERLGMLSLESLDSGAFAQAVFADPVPIPVSDAMRIGEWPRQEGHDPLLEAVALSDDWEFMGPMPGISAAAMVETPLGQRPIAELRFGDLVTTRSHGDQPVRWILRDVRPNVGFDRPVRLRAFPKLLRLYHGRVDKAAKVDGAGFFRIFWSIFLPLCCRS